MAMLLFVSLKGPSSSGTSNVATASIFLTLLVLVANSGGSHADQIVPAAHRFVVLNGNRLVDHNVVAGEGKKAKIVFALAERAFERHRAVERLPALNQVPIDLAPVELRVGEGDLVQIAPGEVEL